MQSGLTWEEDPEGNTFAGGGRTQRTWVRSVETPRRYAMFKRPKPEFPYEIYGIGMERVAYGLALELELNVPEVHLEEHNGEAGSLHRRLTHFRDFVQAGGSPMMHANIIDRDKWPLAVVFDILIANIDRPPRNLLIVPDPPETPPGRALGGTTWLIDHGYAGLYPPGKFDRGLIDARCEDVTLADGRMPAEFEKRIRDEMPPEYRLAFLGLDDGDRAATLDLARGLNDDAIDAVVMEIPEPFMSRTEAELTARLLKLRRDALDQIVQDHWLVP